MKKLLIAIAGIAIVVWLTVSVFPKRKLAIESDQESHSVSSEKVSFQSFGTKTLKPDFFLSSTRLELEAPEFFEADQPEDTLLFVTAKQSKDIEIWPFPFQNTQPSIFDPGITPNGLVIDQTKKQLFATSSQDRTVRSFTLPGLSPLVTLGKGVLESGENNTDILTLPDGTRRLYATDNNEVFGFDLTTNTLAVTLKPYVESIEEVLADSMYQILYVPDEQGGGSDRHPGGAILAFHPDGRPYEKSGSHVLAQGLYGGDAEGITLYRCLDKTGQDTGKGFIVSADQQVGPENGFEFFDRESWKHLGTLHLEGVEETDGVDITERPLPGYPRGMLAAINYDKNISITSWERVEKETGLFCPE